MKLYSIARPTDLARVTALRFRKSISEAVDSYADLISRRLDRAFSEAVQGLAETAPDTPATRAWMHTIRYLAQPGVREQPVPDAFSLGHLEADGPDPGRLFELLCWEGVGATFHIGASCDVELPSAPPRLLSVGVEGAFVVGEPWPTSGRWKLTAAADISLIGPDFVGASSSDLFWKPNVRVAGVGIDACVPLNTAALINRDFQEFPMVRSWGYSVTWAPVLKRAADAISDYSPPAAECVKEFVRCAVPLVAGKEVIGSASREQALGLVFLPATSRPDQLTECLLHEAMHQYLFRIEECGPLFTIDNDVSEKYYSPWRTDARPLRMTLHGAFVFAAVADLYLWKDAPQIFQLDRRECIRRAYHRAKQVRQALATVLGNASLTRFGQIVVEAIEYDLGAILDAAVPSNADRLAVDAELTEHSERYVAYSR
ncbi:hypothetical protein LB515_02485 [Mesorhizobium sp. CA15]|uniref:aKG-HExxH-type peptide beta-hydroxylase n=1 Tax=Mesorhizobium sp. CA15 TaxID=2876641 RepID=UPI001CD1053B|nr:HEXXH motif-containing putative peptide modification protein [Mesorhizobium sp. CA15]MBZ9864234.1 hypothetical protein [Mesorhizobium sp. CA15]